MAIGLPARHDSGSLNCKPDIVAAGSITSVAVDSAVRVGMTGKRRYCPWMDCASRSNWLDSCH